MLRKAIGDGGVVCTGRERKSAYECVCSYVLTLFTLRGSGGMGCPISTKKLRHCRACQ